MPLPALALLFSETIVVYDVKIGRCSELNGYMNLYEYQKSRSFTDLGPMSLILGQSDSHFQTSFP